MKKLKLTSLLLLGMGLFLFSGCGKKYPDGGSIKKSQENIQGTWVLSNYLLNGEDKTSELFISDLTEVYNEGSVEGEGTLARSYKDDKGDPVTEQGSYKFDTDFTEVDVDGVGSIELIDGAGTASSSTYDVLMLTSDEYRYTFVNGGDTHEFRFTKN